MYITEITTVDDVAAVCLWVDSKPQEPRFLHSPATPKTVDSGAFSRDLHCTSLRRAILWTSLVDCHTSHLLVATLASLLLK